MILPPPGFAQPLPDNPSPEPLNYYWTRSCEHGGWYIVFVSGEQVHVTGTSTLKRVGDFDRWEGPIEWPQGYRDIAARTAQGLQ